MGRSRASVPCQGRIIIRTPTKPTPTAANRNGPTRSPNSGIDNSVMNSGATKNNAVASPRGSDARPEKNAKFEMTTSSPRSTCNQGVRVFSR